MGECDEPIPEGYLGNLNNEQEAVLKNMWKCFYEICERNPTRSDELDRLGGPKAAQTGNELLDAQDNSGSRQMPERKAVDGLVKKYGGRYVRQAFWDLTKFDAPDATMLRFLRARKFHLDHAMEMFCAALQFRLDVNLEEILRLGEEGLKNEPGFLNQFRRGISYIEGCTSKGKFPIYFIHVARHFTNAQKIETLQRFVLLAMENSRLFSTPPTEKSCIVFDMQGFGLKNMDWQCVMFILKCLEAFYPESLLRIYVHGAPWVFKGVWSVLQPLLDPEVQKKIKFSNKPHELEDFIPRTRFRKGMGGTLDWDWVYPEPVPGENDLHQDTQTRDAIAAEFAELCKEFDRATMAWVLDNNEAYRRTVLNKQLRLKYYQLMPYIRAVNVYQRTGVLRNDYLITWTYPQLNGTTQHESVNEHHNVPALIHWLREHNEDTLEDSVGGKASPCALAPTQYLPTNAAKAPASPKKKATSGDSQAKAATINPSPVLAPPEAPTQSDAPVRRNKVRRKPTPSPHDARKDQSRSAVPAVPSIESDASFESAEEFDGRDNVVPEVPAAVSLDQDLGDKKEEWHAKCAELKDKYDLDDDEQSMLSDDGPLMSDTVIVPSYATNKVVAAQCQQTEDELRADVQLAHEAMLLFLNSQMREAEDLCIDGADCRLYRAMAMSLINSVKALMTFEPVDLQVAMKCSKHSMELADLLRKKKSPLSKLLPNRQGSLSDMTQLQRHAELVYGESLLCLALVGIVYAGDTIGFLRQTMNLRMAYQVLRELLRMVELEDRLVEEANVHGRSASASVDKDLRSGIYFGNGCTMLALSLLPSRLLKFMEGVGYTADRRRALELFERAGGWSRRGGSEPGVSGDAEGLNRPLCDMAILVYHLVIATNLPMVDVDLPFASKVLSWNLARFPRGIFFLYFAARLCVSQVQPERAVESFQEAMASPHDYRQLHHMCVWSLSLTFLAMQDFERAYECYDMLSRESNWSKAIYQYAKAVTLYEMAGHNHAQAATIMSTVPHLVKKVAGRHIPFERFVQYKAAKFATMGHLGLPALEFSYLWHCFSHTPAPMLIQRQLMRIDEVIDELEGYDSPAKYAGGARIFYSLYCLAFFLRGVALRYAAFPEPHAAAHQSPDTLQFDRNELADDAVQSFLKVFEFGNYLDEVDRYLVYFAHYELGRLYAARGDLFKARTELELVLSRRPLVPQETGPLRSGKAAYPLCHMCQLCSHTAYELLRKPNVPPPPMGVARSLSFRQRSGSGETASAMPRSSLSSVHYNDIPPDVLSRSRSRRDIGRKSRPSRITM